LMANSPNTHVIPSRGITTTAAFINVLKLTQQTKQYFLAKR